MLKRLLAEPPFRLLTRALVRRFVRDPETRVRWSADQPCAYLAGLVEAARIARQDRVLAITAIEFGVAAGRGLLALERFAATVERHSDVQIRVVGFDSGGGLPELLPDHRDHPDYWQAGDFPMDVAALRARLDPARTTLVLGDVRETVPRFLESDYATIGFVSFDLDLYSGTRAALCVLRGGRMLRRTPVYFDDCYGPMNHRWAGERLAIDEFNAASRDVRIDAWHGIRHDKAFPEHGYWDGMFLAHDLKAIGAYAQRGKWRASRRLD